ncbi:PREDICTED: DNA ligase 1 [Nanorana parkeri]|uniref:DNA ligase 1 n=1 Tax=Nanorana parkeri TaxID=125878 RepID=UPI000854563D|nr:PREDICTED: DNA ligase 1 [Nanorana parkeri]
MQRSIKSFFQPKPGGAIKKEEKKKDHGSRKEKCTTTSKNGGEHPLKERNGTTLVSDSDSPVKRIPKKITRVLDSDEEETMDFETTEPTKDNSEASQKEKPATPPVAVSGEGGNGDSSEKSSNAASPDASVTASNIPKRKTARKQITKRKLENISEQDKQDQELNDKEATAKRQKKEADEGLSPKNSESGKESEQCAMDTSPEKTKTPVNKSAVKSEPEEETGQCTTDSSPKKTEEKTGASPSSGNSKKGKGKSDKFFEKKGKKVSEKKTKNQSSEKESEDMSDKHSEEESKVSEKTSEKEVSEKTTEKSSANTPAKPTKNISSFFGATKQDVADQQADYSPSKNSYHPVNDACWTNGQMVPYLAVARTFEMIEDESARLKNIETLSNFLRSVICLSPGDLLPCIYLCLNRLGPAYEGLELGLGETILMKAIAQATGRQLDKIKAEAQEKGDLGLVAESSRSNQRTMFTPPKLTVLGVFNKLKEIAKMTGNASMNKKIDVIKGLFVACRHSEARYIARSLGGKLRIGLAELSVLAAISQAVCLTPPGQEFPPAVIDASKGMSTEAKKAWIEEHSLILKQTFCELPNYDAVIPALLKHGIKELPQHCHLTPGVPLKPMLAHPTKGVGEVLKRFEEAAFTSEYKYDGERAQIHILENGEVHVYSRNQENNTSKYPDIIGRIPKVKKDSVKSCIIDSEAVAWDPQKKQIQPFQVLTTRKRKDVEASEIKVQVCVYAFDMLYLNGESLVREPFSRRRQLLRESFQEVEGEFMFATYMDTSNTDEISEFLDQSIKDSCEGLMVKTLEENATYEIAKRSHNWLKIKKDYLEGLGDTLDLVVIGAYLGKGKRTGKYGGFLLASYDEESEEYQTICKIGTGFTDEDLETHYNFLKDHVIDGARSYYRWDSSTQPDHWLEPVQVWEVKCADLSISPVHKAALGLVEDEKGISLRFPRFLRIRDDKKPEEATNSYQVAELYKKQQQIQNTSAEKGDDDFY